jgi:transposase
VVDLAVGRLALHYAEENPVEVLAALDDKTEAVIRELEARHKEARRSLRRRRDRARVFVLRSGIPWQMLPQQFGWDRG